MADSPLSQKADLVSINVTVNGEETPGKFSIVEVEVKKELNRIPTATVVILDGNPSEVNFEISENDMFKPGGEIKISAGYHQQTEPIFEGLIVSHGVRVKSDEMSELVVKCVDKAAKMTVARKNTYFPMMTDSDIINKILGEYGLGADVESTSITHEEMVQFNCTDWDFIMTRAEANGFVVSVDDGKVFVGKPKADGEASVALTYGDDISKMELEMDARHQVGAIKTEGWNMSGNQVDDGASEEPSVNAQGNVSGKDLAGVLGAGEVKVHSAGPISPEELKTWADGQMLRQRLARIRGKIGFQGMAKPKPNTTAEMSGVGTRFNGNGFISGVYHRIKEHDWDTEVTMGLSPHSFSETQQNISGAGASGMVPGVSGLQIGTVQKIDEDPQGETRILVDVPMITPSGDGIWARQSTYYSTAEAGNFFMPEIGDEVILGFINGDPRYPVILGSMYSKTHMPAYTPDGPNTYKAITTNSKMKIEFEDVKRIITIWTPNNNQIVISDDEQSITISDETKNEIKMSPEGIKMYTPKDFIVEADGLISMTSTKSTVDVEAKMDLTIKGMNVTTDAKTANSMKGTTAEVNGKAQTTIKGGMVMIN